MASISGMTGHPQNIAVATIVFIVSAVGTIGNILIIYSVITQQVSSLMLQFVFKQTVSLKKSEEFCTMYNFPSTFLEV